MPPFDDNKQVLRNTRMFSKASEAALDVVTRALEMIEVKEGEVVFSKGDAGTYMYIVKVGQVRVHDGDVFYNFINEGDIFGEMATLDEEVRSASISAEVDSVLLRLNKEALHGLIGSEPHVSMAIISSLCHSLRDRVQDLTDDYWRIKTLRRELEIGREIQAGFLPRELPDIAGWQTGAYFKAAQNCAGDFYDVFEVGKLQRVALVIGDVCDKGVGAALFMTLFRSLIRASANLEQFVDQGDLPPMLSGGVSPADQLIKSIRLTNNYIAMTHGDTSMFASLFFGLLDPISGTLVYANCGHESPLVVNAGTVRMALDTTGPAVGIFPHANFRINETQLQPGDTLLMFTDGVTEAMNSQKEQFGCERLQALATAGEISAGGLLPNIATELSAFAGDAPQSDDITMLAVKWVPQG
jgi:sigma-B regulation protein RsbU (phosphoserine phosphatase)